MWSHKKYKIISQRFNHNAHQSAANVGVANFTSAIKMRLLLIS